MTTTSLVRALGRTLWCVALAAACTTRVEAPHAPVALTVTVDSTARFQTMQGWEGSSQFGQDEAGFASWPHAALVDSLVDLGIDRVRLELRAGVENPVDWHARLQGRDYEQWRKVRYQTVNDNADPQVIDTAGFQFSEIDRKVALLVGPMRERWAARGESLYVSVCLVAFVGDRPAGYVHQDPAEYAEFVLALFQHLQRRVGWVPDAVELMLEPDNGTPYTGTRLGGALVAVSSRLRAAGFTPAFIGPSTKRMDAAVPFVDDLLRVPGAAGLLTELSYHRYGGVSDATLTAIAQRASQLGVRTAMTELIGADVRTLHDDLTKGNVSAWQQYTLAFPGKDNGGHYFAWQDGRPVMGDRTRYLRQYFRYVRRGAVRVGATVADSASTGGMSSVGAESARVTAFVHPRTGFVTVVQTPAAGAVVVRGLRPGRYGVHMTTAAATGQALADVTADAAGALRVTLPAAGVVTVFAR
ncbi:MAG: hypothetical protein LCH84_02485 [Gemmatimonadetes bacterium]|nr:hypothetical protein [Gemmatimonadota bacterium]